MVSPENAEIARGLSNYSADDVKRIMGKRTSEVRSMLAESAYDEVVHGITCSCCDRNSLRICTDFG